MSEVSSIPINLHIDRRAAELAEEARQGDPDDLMTTAALAEWLGVSPQWLEIGRSRKYGPPFIRLSPSRVRYRRQDVASWLTERTVHHTSRRSSRR